MGSCPCKSKKGVLPSDSSSDTNAACCFCCKRRRKPVPLDESPPDPILVPKVTPVPSPEPPRSPLPVVVQRSRPRQRFKQAGFTNKDFYEAVRGYQKEEIVSLAEALAPFHDKIDGLQKMIDEAMQDCNLSGKDSLTHDESAAIYIFSMTNENGVYDLLHEQWQSLRKPVMRKWWKYLRLLKSALDKLPSVEKQVWQVIPLDQVDTILQEELAELFTTLASCLLPEDDEEFIDSLKGENEKVVLTSYAGMDGKDITPYSKFYPNDGSKTYRDVLIFPAAKLSVAGKEKLPDGSIRLHLKTRETSPIPIRPKVTPVSEPPADVPCLPWKHSSPENDIPTPPQNDTPTPSETTPVKPSIISTLTIAPVRMKHFQCPKRACGNSCDGEHSPNHCRGFSFVYHECAHHCSPKNRCFFCKKQVSKLHQCTSCNWRLCKQCCFQ